MLFAGWYASILLRGPSVEGYEEIAAGGYQLFCGAVIAGAIGYTAWSAYVHFIAPSTHPATRDTIDKARDLTKKIQELAWWSKGLLTRPERRALLQASKAHYDALLQAASSICGDESANIDIPEETERRIRHLQASLTPLQETYNALVELHNEKHAIHAAPSQEAPVARDTLPTLSDADHATQVAATMTKDTLRRLHERIDTTNTAHHHLKDE